MTVYARLRLAIDGRIARLTLSRPRELNALDPRMLDELLAVIGDLSRDEDINALILTGDGRAFCAGVDLSTPFFMEGVEDPSVFAGKRLLDRQHLLVEHLYSLPFVTVAAVNGDAIGGGGFGMAMACDLRIAVRGARFWMVPGTLAVVQDFGLSWLVQRQIGSSRTLEMALLGRPVDAERGAEWGLVNELADDRGALAERIDELADQLGSMGTDALRMLKLVVRSGQASELGNQLRLEAVANGLAFRSTEFAERKAAYLSQLRRTR